MRSVILSAFLFLIPRLVTSQCFNQNFAFSEGEKINYEVYYNWGFIWLNAGYVEFNVKPGKYRNGPIYYLDAYGSSHKSYDWLFKVRDHYQCYLDKETLRPMYFSRENYEGGYEVKNKYYFNPEKNSAISFTENSNKPLTKDTISIPGCTFDLLSILYYCRNLDFSKLNVGDSIPIISIIDNEIFHLFIRYLGKEQIKNKDGVRYNCIKFSALLVEGTIFKGGEDLFAWVTDDLNRIPVLVEAKILIGSVKAYLKETNGVRNAAEARVE
ncbi:MAG: DUF3108 domain-containing protein [Bacteroidales bacterium]|nr:DUF3108 domain-containing protein [Bacteroidales bacterium]